MTERLHLRSVEQETSPTPPSWYVHMQFTTDKELDWTMFRGLGEDIEARYPGSRVAMPNHRTVVIDLAVAEPEKPSVGTIIGYSELLQRDVAPLHLLTFELVKDIPLIATAIEPEQEKAISIGSAMTGEVIYREMPPLSVFPGGKADSQE